MIFWILITVLTLTVLILAFWPAFSQANQGDNVDNQVADFEHDIAVYKDQLTELDAELASGVFSKDDAKQARVEIVRRLLAAEDKLGSKKIDTHMRREHVFGNRILGAVAIIFIPGLSLLMYTSLGSPTIKAQPLAARLEMIKKAEAESTKENKQLIQLVERAEKHLAENPEDGRGWDVLAPVYFRLGQGAKAADAYRNAIRLLGESAPRLAGLGEVLSAQAGGAVTAEAEALFQKAVTLEPSNGRALYYIGLRNAQAGRPDDAARQWNLIVNNENIDGNWRVVAAQSMARLAGQKAIDLPGPDKQAVEDAEQMNEVDRQEMIAGMVEQLDSRLENNVGTVEEWQRLIRARMVLNQRDEAVAAVKRAIAAFADEPQKQLQIQSFAKDIGLKEIQ
ncbi:c-type cytochrome biogenesis protein CcmI [Ahrensia kielensis]|uniref:C-type cytochrome biogenesis protein CcmI n=1 Tax=Ahrensia kielensis TaxID=76980 RepID=A0ABU9T8C6_9HYPH